MALSGFIKQLLETDSVFSSEATGTKYYLVMTSIRRPNKIYYCPQHVN